MKYLYLIVLLLHPFYAYPAATFFELNSGLNHLDLNSDGILDAVFYSRFDNNTSHPDPTLSVYIKDSDATYSIVPTPAGDRFTLFGINVSVSNILVRSFGFIKTSKQVYLVVAVKSGDSPHLKQFFKFKLYQIEKNLEHPGIPLYGWTQVGEKISKNKYMSADVAIRECPKTCFE
ncbi:carbapenem self-resistance protein CarG family protein [Vibrio sp. MEBiC08052]|uniref:carbapenem self-resistance protein CarG family protein n=1 Tax=Vibrio sp. MEBiC08052 TaxID=1761910 RepID=UPI0007406EB2|nr:hypothetical protein [Vibrio sp. MEBiC08052]KUI96591.1 hypothetical protein VRK_42860 [Vibrio sp. MEBiC08052]